MRRTWSDMCLTNTHVCACVGVRGRAFAMYAVFVYAVVQLATQYVICFPFDRDFSLNVNVFTAARNVTIRYLTNSYFHLSKKCVSSDKSTKNIHFLISQKCHRMQLIGKWKSICQP